MGDYTEREPILCIRRFLTLKEGRKPFSEVIRLRNYHGLTGAFGKDTDFNMLASSLLYTFSYRDTLQNNGMEVHKRNHVEFNEKYKQIVVGLLVTNPEHTKALLLRKKTRNDFNQLTLIQGHVSAPESYKDDEEAYLSSTTLYDVLYDNMLREAEEEVQGLVSIFYNSAPNTMHIEYFANNDFDRTDIAYYHTGFIFELVVDNIEELAKFKSGEPEKHAVELVEVDKIIDDPNLDPWVREIFKLNQ